MRAKPRWIIGIDEVGRGPLAGPVYVCAVAMLREYRSKVRWTGLTDSKQLSVKTRELWHAKAQQLQKTGKLRIAVARQHATVIDKKGIARSISECISSVLHALEIDPADAEVLLDGGLRAPGHYPSQKTIIRGDQSEKIISLASVVAKVRRDAHMVKMSKKHPEYDWHTNMGYGTRTHILMLKTHGLTPLHRKTYLSRLIDN